jgi:hypothetical protein
MGAAISHGKKLVPIMWDLQPSDLPRWIADFQGLILSGATMENINLQMSQLAERVKSDKLKGQLVAGAVFAGLLYLLANQSNKPSQQDLFCCRFAPKRKISLCLGR